MKKIFIFLGVSILILGGISPALNGETQKGLHLGVSIGTFPFVPAFNSYRVGGEIGYQFTDRVGINMEFGYGYITSNYESDEQSQYFQSSYSRETTYSAVPISGSLLFTTPVGNGFTAYVGIGLGYYTIKIKNDWTRESSYSGTTSDTAEEEAKGFAPHINIGIESAISKRITIFGELKHIVGKIESEETENGYHRKERFPFGGTEARIGFRFYF